MPFDGGLADTRAWILMQNVRSSISGLPLPFQRGQGAWFDSDADSCGHGHEIGLFPAVLAKASGENHLPL